MLALHPSDIVAWVVGVIARIYSIATTNINTNISVLPYSVLRLLLLYFIILTLNNNFE